MVISTKTIDNFTANEHVDWYKEDLENGHVRGLLSIIENAMKELTNSPLTREFVFYSKTSDFFQDYYRIVVLILPEVREEALVQLPPVQGGLQVDGEAVLLPSEVPHVGGGGEDQGAADAEMGEEQLAEVLINNGILFLVNDFYRNIFQPFQSVIIRYTNFCLVFS